MLGTRDKKSSNNSIKNDLIIGHFRITFSLFFKPSLALVLILSYENEFNLHLNENSFSYERMSTETRFEKEAKGNSEMAYYQNAQIMLALLLGRNYASLPKIMLA